MPPSAIQQTRKNLQSAVHQNSAGTRAGFLERMFTFAFKGLVYPQIWEDPEVDLDALKLTPQSRMLTIASGGCNVLSYLTADPKEIIAVDLNRAHLALTRLKLAAAQGVPTYEAFYRFFGEADEQANINTYKRFVRERLDKQSRAYWEGRDWMLQRRISLFSRDLYHHGLLGYFIGAAHWVARLHGTDPRQIVFARTIDEQRSFFDKALAPLFDRRMVRWVTSKKMSLYGLGIPPAQYEALAADGGGDMAAVLKTRLEKLACGFPMADNYFAWQAFGRGYASGPSGPLPPYLQSAHFHEVQDRAHRVTVNHRSVTEQLQREADGSMDAYVLLDAQDWMTDSQLTELWAEITRTAQPGARVVFRTAGQPSILPGRVDDDIMARWEYRADESLGYTARDRSAIYGGVHLYVFKGCHRMTDAASSTSELMDSIYRTQRHIYDLTRKYYLLGRDRLIRELAPPEDGCVLEVGCGTGRNLIKAARRYPRARFYGIDISEAMLEKARAEIMRAGFAHRIELARADAASFEAHSLFGRSDFDRVFFSYSLSMIPRWREALGQGFSVTGAGGRLLVVDFGMQQRLPAWFRRLLMWWLKQFHVAPRAELGAAIDTLGKGRTQELYGDYARIAEVVR